MLTFGTGIGFSAILEGQVFRGFDGTHPELGHIPILPNGPKCYCGMKGCLESLASGTAIDLTGRGCGFASARSVFEAANAGNTQALSIVDQASWATATAIWTNVHTFWPQTIILGGGLMETHFDCFYSAIRDQIDKAVLIPNRDVVVAKALLAIVRELSVRHHWSASRVRDCFAATSNQF